MLNSIHEECGVFGIFGQMDTDVALQAYVALYALQHRGQESCGIAVNNDGLIHYHRDVGLVPEVFTHEVLAKLGKGNMAVGHVRHATAATHNRTNAQPLVVHHRKGTMVLAHNGNLTNAPQLREELELQGAIFHSTTDTEVMSHVIIRARLKSKSIEQAISRAMDKIQGAYSQVIMSPQKMIAVRDPKGFRPLCMGKLGESIIFASESCALDGIGATFVRDIDPGEIVVVTRDPQGEVRIKSDRTHCGERGSLCVFEFVYFARPDSVVQGVTVHNARVRAGMLLAREHPVQADVVIGVPDSGLDAAMGYARESGIPYGLGFIKNRYVGRTFIQPTQGERDAAVRIKLNAIEETVRGKRVVMIDDSIVRGTTSWRLVKLLRDAGATEIHVRISAPPFLHPCYFGTDIDSRDKLIANQLTVEQIAQRMGVDSLGYISVEGVNRIAEGATCGFCDGCFTGRYPLPEPEYIPSNKFERKISEGHSRPQAIDD